MDRADPSPGGRLSTLPGRRTGHGTRYAPGTEKGCCVGGTWRDSEAVGGQVELESRAVLWVCYNKLFSKIHLDTTTAEEQYIVWIQSVVAAV